MPEQSAMERGSSLQGRESDLRVIDELVARNRLVTIVGLGGMGKTAVAAELGRRWEVPVIDLSRITDPEGVATLVATTLGVSEQSTRGAVDRVARHIGSDATTVILDNCEHVLSGVVDLLLVLLERCPQLHVLATSTVRLGLVEEHIHDLPPLALPEGDTLAEVRAADAVALFRRRARQHRPGFEVTSENMADVVGICRRLDGLPLALELAAARMSVLSAAELHARLDQRFAVLTKGGAGRPARHQTLRALVEWSFERCPEKERVLWARLSVFNGSFRLEQAEEICAFDGIEPGEVLDLLDALVSRSLLQVEHGGKVVRYRQLATIRDFGAQKVIEAGEDERCRDNLLAFTLRQTRRMVGEWVGPRQEEALAIWRAEHATIVSALQWTIADHRRCDDAAELLALLRYHWVSGGYLADGREWFDRVLGGCAVASQQRQHASWVAAWVCLLQGDRAAGRAYVEQAVSHGSADVGGVYLAQALAHMFAGELDAAVAGYGHTIERCLAQGDLGLAMSAMFQRAMAQTYRGDHDAAVRTADALIARAEEHGERWNRAYGCWIRGVALWHRGDLEEAEASCRSALEIQRDFADGICVALTVLTLLWIHVARGDERTAAELNTVVARVWETLGTSEHAFGEHVAAEQQRCGLPPVSGVTGMAIRDAVERVLQMDRAEPMTVPGLSGREREVLALLADGASNRQIAERLVISQRTAEGHVGRILAKLELRSRSEVASWCQRHANSGERTR